jgi:hypothetical protein
MKKINKLFITWVLIILGVLIAEHGSDIMYSRDEGLGILLILLGTLFIMIGVIRLYGAEEFLENLIFSDKKTIVVCPSCKQKCSVPINKSLTITCPKCKINWSLKT